MPPNRSGHACLPSNDGDWQPDEQLAGASLCNALLDELALAMLAVTRDGNLLYANAVALKELAAGTAIRIRCGAVRAADSASERRLRIAMDEVLAAPRGRCTADIARPEGGGVSLHLVRLDCSAPPAIGMIFRVPHSVHGDGLRQRWGLTATEFAVLLELADGQEPSEVAARQGVALSTVRTHLHNLLQKAGVRRQADLVRLALTDDPPVRR